MSGYSMTKPCPGCPFTTGPDAVHFLGRRRAEEIRDALLNGQTFSCHKTTGGSWVEDEDGHECYVPSRDEEHCAGAMILLERIERPNQMMRIAERIGLYDMTKLDMDYPTMMEDFDEFVEVQSRHEREPA